MKEPATARLGHHPFDSSKLFLNYLLVTVTW